MYLTFRVSNWRQFSLSTILNLLNFALGFLFQNLMTQRISDFNKNRKVLSFRQRNIFYIVSPLFFIFSKHPSLVKMLHLKIEKFAFFLAGVRSSRG